MRYHLSYNEKTGRFRIDQTGATIPSEDTKGFNMVWSSDDLWPLITAYNLIRARNADLDIFMDTAAVRNYLDNHLRPLDENDDLVINTGD